MKNVFRKRINSFISIVLVILLCFSMFPLSTLVNAQSADLRCESLDYGDFMAYFYGVDSAEKYGVTTDEVIVKCGSDISEKSFGVYLNGQSVDPGDKVNVDYDNNSISINYDWAKENCDWIAFKCSENAYIPEKDPSLPKIDDVDISGIDVEYTGDVFDAVNVTGNVGAYTVEYSTDGGKSFSKTCPKMQYVNDGPMTVLVRVSGDSKRELLKEVTSNIRKGRNQVSAEGIETSYRNGKEIELLKNVSAKEAVLSFSLDGTTFDTSIPKRSEVGEYTVYIKVTPNDTDNYEEYIITRTAKIEALTFDGKVEIKAASFEYDGNLHDAYQINANKIDDLKVTYKCIQTEETGEGIHQVKDAGVYDYSLTLSAKGYEEKTISITTNVEKGNPKVEYKLTDKTVYDGNETPVISELSASNGTGKFSFVLNGQEYDKIPSVKDAGDYTLTIRAAESDNYKAFSKELNFTIEKAKFTMAFPDDIPGTIIYNDKNNFSFQYSVVDSQLLEEDTIMYTLPPESNTGIAVIDEKTGKVTYNDSGVITVCAIFGEDKNYEVDASNKMITYTIKVDYNAVPEYEISDSYFSDGSYNWYNEFSIKAPEGWQIRKEGTGVYYENDSDGQLIDKTEWLNEISEDMIGSYSGYQIRLRNIETGQYTNAITIDPFVIDTTAPNPVKFFSFVEVKNDETVKEIVNALSFGTFFKKEIKVTATVGEKNVGQALATASQVCFIVDDGTEEIKSYYVDVENGTATLSLENGFKGKISAMVIGQNIDSENNVSQVAEVNKDNSNVEFKEGGEFIVVDTSEPIINNIQVEYVVPNSDGNIANINVEQDEVITVPDDYTIIIDAGDDMSGLRTATITSEFIPEGSNNSIMRGRKTRYPSDNNQAVNQLVHDYVFRIDDKPEMSKIKFTISVTNNAMLKSEFVFYVEGDTTPPTITDVSLVSLIDKLNQKVQMEAEQEKSDFAYIESKDNKNDDIISVSVDDTLNGTVFSCGGIFVNYQFVNFDGSNNASGNAEYDSINDCYNIEIPKDENGQFKGWAYIQAGDGANHLSDVIWTKGMIIGGKMDDNDPEFAKPETEILTTKRTSSFNINSLINKDDGETLIEVYTPEKGVVDLYPALKSGEAENNYVFTIKNDFSGIHSVDFFLYNGTSLVDLKEDNKEDKIIEEIIPSQKNDDYGINRTIKYTIGSSLLNRNYYDQTLVVKVMDNADNVYYSYYTFAIDTNTPGIPGIEVIGDHADRDDWYVSDCPVVTINPAGADKCGSLEYVYWKWENEEEYKLLTDITPSISEDGIYKVYTYAIDEANHRSQDNEELIKYDSTKPEVTAYIDDLQILDLENAQGYLFYNHTITMSMKASDNLSGIRNLEYQIVYKGESFDENGWKDYDDNNRPTVSPNQSFVFYAKATDEAGNVTERSSINVVVDDKSPVGQDYSKPDVDYSLPATSTGFYTSNVPINISVVDHRYTNQTPNENGSCSGIKSFDYSVTVDGVQKTAGSFTIGDGTGNQIVEQQNFVLTLDAMMCNSNNVVVRFSVFDNAGNETVTVIEPGEIKIDMTDPEIYVSYDNNSPVNDHFYSSQRVATVVVTERNFNPDLVDITITNTDGTPAQFSGWTHTAGTGNGDNATHTMYITYGADGDYEFDISMTDMAGRSNNGVAFEAGTMNPNSFTIDMTKPEVSVSYDNNAAANGKYFNAERNATITVVEHNFDLEFVETRITAALAGQGIEVPGISWSHSGDTHTGYISYNYDGDFTFDFDMVDLASNPIDGVNYGSSAAAQEFTVDMTIETPDINNVASGMAYREEVIPSVSFSDINFADYSITLTRTRMFEINEDVTEQFIDGYVSLTSTGGSGTFDTFESIRENDGIYTLTIDIEDLAGNTATNQVVFSVNRFGSVYVFGDYLVGLRDTYQQEITEDLIITEYNPDQLVEGSVFVQVVRDSVLLDDVNFEVNPAVNAFAQVGESGWYQYEYSIDKANFQEEGIYSMSISSEDQAGNTPDTMSFEDCDVLFRVDRTPPRLTDIQGLNEAIVNASSIDVTFNIFDSIGLANVDVYVSGNKVATFDTFDNIVNFVGNFTIGEGADQTVRIEATDLAGNSMNTDQARESDASFVRSVTVSTNFFVRWYANKALFWSSIIGILLVLGFIIFIVYRRRRREEEQEQ